MKTILIADDSDSLRALVCRTLEDEGYFVLQGIDGDDALKHLNGTSIDLVITDLHMPNLNGIDLIKKIRATPDYSYVPILLLTTESQESKKNEARSAGATGWITKPFIQERLLEVVKRTIK